MAGAMGDVLFHLAFPVGNLQDTKRFYADGLGCQLGRESAAALILNLYGHQLVAHVTQDLGTPQSGIYPRHFGLVFNREVDWEHLVDRARQQNLTFYQPPRLRFPGERTEHRTVFLADPFHNLLEFKFYRHPEAIFGQLQGAAVGDRAS